MITSSVSSSGPYSTTRSPLTQVPARLPLSTSLNPPASWWISAWARATFHPASTTPFPEPRPMSTGNRSNDSSRGALPCSTMVSLSMASVPALLLALRFRFEFLQCLGTTLRGFGGLLRVQRRAGTNDARSQEDHELGLVAPVVAALEQLTEHRDVA